MVFISHHTSRSMAAVTQVIKRSPCLFKTAAEDVGGFSVAEDVGEVDGGFSVAEDVGEVDGGLLNTVDVGEVDG